MFVYLTSVRHNAQLTPLTTAVTLGKRHAISNTEGLLRLQANVLNMYRVAEHFIKVTMGTINRS